MSLERRARGSCAAILVPILLGALGCHTMRFEVSSEPSTHEMHHRKSFNSCGV